MKKTFLFGIVAAMLATACTEEESFNQIASGEGIQFISSVASRATDNSFETGDEIGISMYVNGAVASEANNVKYTSNNGNTFTGTEITWEAAGGASTADFIGVYPYKEGSISEGKYSFTLSDSDENKLSENDVMYAHTPNILNGTGTVSLNFEHKLVKVVMNVKDQDGDAVTNATMTINKQQLEGTLDLTTGDVTSADVADNDLEFASNTAIHGEYQTIVMPSAATQGRIITIFANGKTYPCPVDMYAFESGKKITFSATIYTDGTVTSEGKVTITADVTDWSENKVEEGWIFGEDADFNIIDKPSYQLAANMSLSSTPSAIEVDGTLDKNDVYSFVYTRTDATKAATITVGAEGGSSREFTLPAGSTSGTMLIPVSEYNTTGMTISSEDEGITLTKVLVYTSQAIELPAQPVVLWTGDGTAGNGVADMGVWPPKLAEFTINEADRDKLAVGATIQIHYTTLGTLNISNGPGFYSNNNFGKNDEENKVVSTVVTLPLYEAIVNSDYKVTLATDWEGKAVINSVELLPSTGEGISENLLWWTGVDVYMSYSRIDMWLPASLAEGDIIRVNCKDVSEGAKLKGAQVSWGDSGEVLDVVLTEQTPSAGATTVDFKIDATLLSTLKEKIGVGTALTLIGENLAVTSIELVCAGGN